MRKVIFSLLCFIFLSGCTSLPPKTDKPITTNPVIESNPNNLIEANFLNAPIFIDLKSQTQIYLPKTIAAYDIKWDFDEENFKYQEGFLLIKKDGKTTIAATVNNDKYTYTETFSFEIKNKKIIKSEQHGLVFFYNFLDSSNQKVGKTLKPQMIVFHNTANTASAYNEIKYLHSSYNTSKTSYHYAVDEIGIYQAIPTTNYAYHAGVMDINQKSIGIEIAKSMTNDHVIKDIATKNAIKLISLLMYNYAITYDDVITHQMASGKYCPHDILSRYGLDRFYEELRQENALYKDYVAINEK